MTRKPWDKGGKTRHQQGYGSAWSKLRLVVIERDRGLCQLCLARGRIAAGNQVDHKLSKAKGGTDDLDNLWLLCRPCHDRKTIEEKGHRIRPRFDVSGWPVEGDP